MTGPLRLKTIPLLLLLLACAAARAGGQAPPASPAEGERKFSAMQAAGLVAAAEGAALLNASFAKSAPAVYGGLMMLVCPLAASDQRGDAANTAAIIGAGAIGLYNFSYTSRDSAARRRRFWVTFAGLNALVGVAGITDRLTGGRQSREPGPEAARGGWSLGAMPAPGGVLLAASRRF